LKTKRNNEQRHCARAKHIIHNITYTHRRAYDAHGYVPTYNTYVYNIRPDWYESNLPDRRAIRIYLLRYFEQNTTTRAALESYTYYYYTIIDCSKRVRRPFVLKGEKKKDKPEHINHRVLYNQLLRVLYARYAYTFVHTHA